MIYVDEDYYEYLQEQNKKVWKAIEYIEGYNLNNMEYNTQTLLDILKGSDKE